MTCAMAGLLRHSCSIVRKTETGQRNGRGKKVESKGTTAGVMCFLTPLTAKDRYTNADAAVATHKLLLDGDQGIDENDAVTVLTDENGDTLLSRAEVTGVLRQPGAFGISHIECLLKEIRNGTNS